MNLTEIGLEDVDWVHLAQDMKPMVGPRDYGNEPSGSIRGEEFLAQLSDYQLLKSDRDSPSVSQLVS
jgi:hypothetical protein